MEKSGNGEWVIAGRPQHGGGTYTTTTLRKSSPQQSQFRFPANGILHCYLPRIIQTSILGRRTQVPQPRALFNTQPCLSVHCLTLLFYTECLTVFEDLFHQLSILINRIKIIPQNCNISTVILGLIENISLVQVSIINIDWSRRNKVIN